MSQAIELDRIVGISVSRRKQTSMVGDDNLHVLDHLIHLAQAIS